MKRSFRYLLGMMWVVGGAQLALGDGGLPPQSSEFPSNSEFPLGAFSGAPSALTPAEEAAKKEEERAQQIRTVAKYAAGIVAVAAVGYMVHKAHGIYTAARQPATTVLLQNELQRADLLAEAARIRENISEDKEKSNSWLGWFDSVKWRVHRRNVKNYSRMASIQDQLSVLNH